MSKKDKESKIAKVVQYGLGPIGLETVKAVLNRKRLKLVGAIDIAPDKIGKDVGELLGMDKSLGIVVSDNADTVLSKTNPDIVLHTTSSFMKDVFPQLKGIIEHGTNVVSSTEELLFPQLRNPDLARQLDELARKHRVTVLGTGVNPGFVMDTLALILTGVCTDITKIKITRCVDAATRRQPLQKKVGAGLAPAEFKKQTQEGSLGHVGLAESAALIAYGLGWDPIKIEETIDPVIAEKDVKTKYLEVKKGQVAGIKHIARGLQNGKELITLDLRMYVGAADPRDSIFIEGSPVIDMTIRKGIMGDIATVASLVNAIPRVLDAEPGLKTMADLPIPKAYL